MKKRRKKIEGVKARRAIRMEIGENMDFKSSGAEFSKAFSTAMMACKLRQIHME